eukprot:4423829-Alexandrium_andersonii.AAC.1
MPEGAAQLAPQLASAWSRQLSRSGSPSPPRTRRRRTALRDGSGARRPRWPAASPAPAAVVGAGRSGARATTRPLSQAAPWRSRA